MTTAYLVIAMTQLLILVPQWLMPRLTEKSVPFGVRVPPDRMNDPAVSDAHRRYRLGMTVTTAISLCAWVWAWRFGVGSHHTGWMAALPVVPLLFGFVTYYLARSVVLAKKREDHWMEGYRQVITVDARMGSTTTIEKASWTWGIPALVITLATFIVGAVWYPHIPSVFPIHFGPTGVADRFTKKSVVSVFNLASIQVVMIGVMAGVHGVVSRIRDPLDPASPLSSARQQAHRQARLVRAAWLLMALVNLGLSWVSLVVWGKVHPDPAGTAWGTLLPIVIGMAFIWVAAARSKEPSTSSPTSHASKKIRPDDDANWVLGAIYFNRNDPRFVVQKRFGVGWTTNFAHPLSWVFLALLVIICIGVPVLGQLLKKG